MMQRVNKQVFVDFVKDCSFKDSFNRTGSAVIRKFTSNGKLFGYILNWDKYYIFTK